MNCLLPRDATLARYVDSLSAFPWTAHPLRSDWSQPRLTESLHGHSVQIRRDQLRWTYARWINRESRDLRWRCGCLFTFVGASRGHLCDSTAFLLYFVVRTLLHEKVCGRITASSAEYVDR